MAESEPTIFDRLTAGDKRACDFLIEYFYPFAKRQAIRWKYAYPTHKDEMQSVAAVALIKAVRYAATLDHTPTEDELLALITTAIKQAVIDYVFHDQLIPVSRQSLNRGASVICVYQMAENHDVMDSHGTELPEEVDEIINRLPVHDTCKEILRLHAVEGWSYSDIGKHLGLSRQMISWHIKQARTNATRKVLSESILGYGRCAC